MTGFLLQVGGPLQSWGEHSSFNDRDTVAHPTRSGLIGLIASALGIPRHEATSGDGPPTLFESLGHLRFTVRHDRPGTRLRDFHTVGGGLPTHRTVPTAKGGRRGTGQATIVSDRHYLADAVFSVAVTAPSAPDPDHLLHQCASALAAPHWPPYLGRRSCPPGTVFLLAARRDDPAADLRTNFPLARPRPTGHAVRVRFTSDTPFDETTSGETLSGETTSGETLSGDTAGAVPSARDAVTSLNDDPVRFTPQNRAYRTRPSYTTSHSLPAGLCAGYGPAYLDALLAYLRPSTPQDEPA
ncbi:type I-E CRISPR-associated protein Cas5/CasD [Streptomyces sp. NPDC093249]|uniref:type I-E CRISPR-associated protein Cas5/CasD n=1 Tax=unclassified Streptomyces TaxID=2593676 RepID=UPI0037F7E2D8